MPWFRSFAILTLLASAAVAGDWPQWLGPRRDGSTDEKVTPWKGNLDPVWKQAVGEGHSSPIVADGRVFLHTRAAGKEVEVMECFDAGSGKQVWRQEYPRSTFKGLFGNGPRATPAVAGGKVYSMGANGILTCFDATKGDKLWQIDTRKEFNTPDLTFGVSTSPLVAGNKVVVNVGAKGASVVAFDKDTGKVLWKSLDDKASYASPILIGPEKVLTVAILTQTRFVGLRLEDGKLEWAFPFQDPLFETSVTPVRLGDKLLISSIKQGSALVALERKDDKTAAKRLWLKDDLTGYFSTPVPVGNEYVYLVSSSIPAGPATLHCVEVKSGTVLWKKAGVGKFHASLMRTADNKLLMLEESGNLVLIEPDAKAYKELARARICGTTWAHPALANGKLFIRDDSKQLICVNLGQ